MDYNDALKEVPVDQWPLLKERLKSLWPINVGGYYALDMHIKHPLIREVFNFRVYCPYGDLDKGFIAISKKDVEKEYFICSVDEDTSYLEEALANTKRIDWNSKLYIVMATSLTLRLVYDLKSRMDFEIFRESNFKTFYLDNSSKPYAVLCPPETYLSAIDPDDINQVNDVWANKNPRSKHYFPTLASNGFSYGLYSFDKKLLAWIFLNEYNFLRHLYCKPEHRRKGYGEFLVKSLVNDCLMKGKHVYGFVVLGNHNAMKLFKKLGFQLVNDTTFMNIGNQN